MQAAGLGLDIHVNIGAARLGSREFEQQVTRILDRHAVEPGRLVLELDRSLAVGTRPDRGLALYRSVIGLCGALGLDVIAEGIESRRRLTRCSGARYRWASCAVRCRRLPAKRPRSSEIETGCHQSAGDGVCP
jgi:EAL domain-containing protein (putative c-di-GMP-specific phosphodiesterase class I)